MEKSFELSQSFPDKRVFLMFGFTVFFSLLFLGAAFILDFYPIRILFVSTAIIAWIFVITYSIMNIFTRLEIDETKLLYKNIIARRSYSISKFDYIILEKNKWYFPHRKKRRFDYKIEFFKPTQKFNPEEIAQRANLRLYQRGEQKIFSRLPEVEALEIEGNDYREWLKSITK